MLVHVQHAYSFIDEDEHKMHCTLQSVTLNEIYLLISWDAMSFLAIITKEIVSYGRPNSGNQVS